MSISKIRSWLERNKIFFEVLSYTVLGLMAIAVSVAQVLTAIREYELHKIEKQPLIRISERFFLDDTANGQKTKSVIISNEGELLKKFVCDFRTFYAVSYDCAKCPKKRKIYIPIDDYYQSRFETGNPKGKLLEALTNGNYENFSRLYEECLQHSVSSSSYYVDKITTLTIRYEDITGERHVEYYELDQIGKGFEVEKERVDGIVSESESIFHNVSFTLARFDFDRMIEVLARAKM